MLVSVIVPTLNEAENIQACCRAAQRSYGDGQVEIIIADGGSSDGTLDCVPDGIRVVNAPRGRGTQMNRGAAAAQGEILLFCHADSKLPQGWREAVIQALRDPEVSGGGFQIAYLPPKGILHWVNRMKFHGRWFAVHGDRAQFMSRSTFDAINGFQEIPLMEDVEMARALHRRGRIVLMPERVLASSRRYLERGPLFQYLLSVWLMARYLFLNATPEDIARAYRSSREQKADQHKYSTERSTS